jgi:hypothetical protein
MLASKAATTIAVTQVLAAKKRKRSGPAVSVDTTTASTETEMVAVEEDDVRSPNTPVVKVVQTPHKVVEEEGALRQVQANLRHGFA